MSKKKKGQLTYFLDHPQIKRHPSPGNGNSPGFFGQLSSGKLSNPSASKSKAQPARPSSTARPSSGSSTGSSQSSWQKAFSKGFKG